MRAKGKRRQGVGDGQMVGPLLGITRKFFAPGRCLRRLRRFKEFLGWAEFEVTNFLYTNFQLLFPQSG